MKRRGSSIAGALLDVVEPGSAHPKPVREVFESRPRLTIPDSLIEGHSLHFEEGGQIVAGLGHVTPETVGVRAWDVDTGRLLRTKPGPLGVTQGLALDPIHAAGRRRDGSVRVWHASAADIDYVIPTPHAKSLTGAALAPFDVEGTRMATWGVVQTPAGGDLDEIKVWATQTGKSLRTHRDVRVNVLSFSADGKTMASAGLDRRVTLWDVATGEVLRTLSGHRGPILALAFAPDGKTLATGDTIHEGRIESSGGRIGWKAISGEVKLWDLATGQPRRTFTGLGHGIGAVAVSPDGTRVAGATYYGGITRVWDASTGVTLKTFAVPGVAGVDAQFTPDGRELATVGSEGIIRIWDSGR